MAFRPPDPKSMGGGGGRWRTLANQPITSLELRMRGRCWRRICFGFATGARARVFRLWPVVGTNWAQRRLAHLTSFSAFISGNASSAETCVSVSGSRPDTAVTRMFLCPKRK